MEAHLDKHIEEQHLQNLHAMVVAINSGEGAIFQEHFEKLYEDIATDVDAEVRVN